MMVNFLLFFGPLVGLMTVPPIAVTIGLAWHVIASRKRWTSVHACWLPGMLAGALIAGLCLVMYAPVLIAIAAPYGAYLVR